MNESRSFPDVFPMGRGAGSRLAATRDRLSLARRSEFQLGAATIRPSIRTVEGPGGSLAVEPRVMQVLLALADAEGAVLTREDFIRICWGGQIVGDDAINRSIAEVRRVARATDAGFGVETIPRIGYRLTVTSPIHTPALADSTTEAPALGNIDPTRRYLLAGGLATALAGAAFFASRSSSPDPATSLVEESRVAMRAGTPEAAREALSLLERAVALSPENAGAWGLLALTRAQADEHSHKAGSPAASVDKAAHRALQLDSNNADARAALAIAIPYYGDWLAAERRFDAVLAQHPQHLVTRDSRAFFLGAVGRMREGAQERLSFSQEASFDANFQLRLIYAHWFLSRLPEADRVAARGLEMWPRHPGIWYGRLWLLADTGRFERALGHINDSAKRPPIPPPMLNMLRAGIGAAQSKRSQEAAAAVAQIMTAVRQNVAAVVNGLMLLNLMGELDAAFDLARAYYLEQGSIAAATHSNPGQLIIPDQRRRKTNMLFTPTAAGMQKDERFAPLLTEMGLTTYWRRRGVVPDFLRASHK